MYFRALTGGLARDTLSSTMLTKRYYRWLQPDYRLDVEIHIDGGQVARYRVSLQYDSGDEWVEIGETERVSSESRQDMEDALGKAQERLEGAFEGHRKKRRQV